MRNGVRLLGIAAAFAVGVSSAALAQVCPPGYMPYGGMCQPMAGPAPGAYAPGYAPGAYAPNNPVSGAAAGAASGAAAGNAVAGPIGGIVGGALGTATGTLAGTTNAIAGAPVATVGGMPAAPAACPPGRTLYNGYCY